MDEHGKLRALVGAVAFAATLASPAAGADCRQALALGLDVSGSVNAREYRLQLDGLAAALNDPNVVEVLLSVPASPVRIMVFEWSGTSDQREVLAWTDITDRAVLATVSEGLRATSRSPSNPATALGSAMVFGAQRLAAQAGCRTRTLDLSGDGKSNTGPGPQDVAANPVFQGVTLNALVVGSDRPDGGVAADEIQALQTYFQSRVIRGPGAFTETVTGFADFQHAMTRKLLRELEGLAVSENRHTPDTRQRL